MGLLRPCGHRMGSMLKQGTVQRTGNDQPCKERLVDHRATNSHPQSGWSLTHAAQARLSAMRYTQASDYLRDIINTSWNYTDKKWHFNWY